MSARRSKADGPAVRTEGLVRSFGDNVAVDGVDLEVASGEIYGFLGPNGAGKSTRKGCLVSLRCVRKNLLGGESEHETDQRKSLAETAAC